MAVLETHAASVAFGDTFIRVAVECLLAPSDFLYPAGKAMLEWHLFVMLKNDASPMMTATHDVDITMSITERLIHGA
jgi:hypothetical protein